MRAYPPDLFGDIVPVGRQQAAFTGYEDLAEEEGFVDNATARFGIVDSEDAFAAELESCQVLLEVIFEDLDLKCEVLAKIAPRLPDGGLNPAAVGVTSGTVIPLTASTAVPAGTMRIAARGLRIAAANSA